MNNMLDEIKLCPWCHKDVKYGEMIWLDGDCLCPDCYKHKRQKYDMLDKQGYDRATNQYRKWLEEE